MKLTHALLLAVPVAALAITDANVASACGGCFVPPEESTQVTGHRMLLSISQQQTTLWDQISYSGNPSSFAWILPIKGTVQVGLSSDALFAFVEQSTQVTVLPPPVICPAPPACANYGEGDFAGDGAAATSGAGGGLSDPGVTVVAQATVGPYETVQLASTDPGALEKWLSDHNYAIPSDIAPVVNAYVKEGFNFLALKLVPGTDVSAMRPVRVTSMGASPTLPLRMVAAGTGAVTPITLWVLGEGRYEAANFENAAITPASIVWNWNTNDSNYATVRNSIFTSSGGLTWLTETARATAMYDITGNLLLVAQNNPAASGYGDAQGNGAAMEAQDDINTLVDGINPASLWVTRLHAELSRAALAKDLDVQASTTQTPVSNLIQTVIATGSPPPCPTYTCDDPGAGVGFFGGAPSVSGGSGSGSCAIGTGGGVPATVSALGVLMALSLVRRRNRRAGRSR
jgi:Uncharacterized protein conserved in bacteria (DUF2330)